MLYADFVSAIIEMRVYSVEDGHAHECGAEKSQLSLPVRGRKSISAHQQQRLPGGLFIGNKGKRELASTGLST